MNECFCRLDEDGRCKECFDKIRAKVSILLSLLKEFTERIEEAKEISFGMCEYCKKKELDAAFAAVVREFFSKLPKEVLVNLAPSIRGLLHTNGVREIPITDMELRKLLG